MSKTEEPFKMRDKLKIQHIFLPHKNLDHVGADDHHKHLVYFVT